MRRSFSIISFFGALLFTSATFAQCDIPNQLTNGQMADATQLMANFESLRNCIPTPGGANNSVQLNDGNGGLNGIGPLSDGQLIIGNSSGAPQASTLTAGTGISIVNSPGNVTISSGGGSSFQREFGPFAPPNAATFTMIDSPASIVPTVTNVANVGLVYSVPITSNTTAFPGAYRIVPTSATWTLTLRAKYPTLMGSFPEFGVWIKDSAGKMLGAVMESRSSSASLVVKRCDSNISLNTNPYVQGISDAPNWFRIQFDGTNIIFSTSWDGQNWLIFWSEAKTTFLNGNLSYVGIGGITGISSTSLWRPGSTLGGLVTYWDIDDDPASNRVIP
ncbi:hypothetical protein [Rhizobium sp. ZPR3]|uniref:Uncharacterized protein n=2 Tax=unclassified Rhizobium TaxID=2613769 RepID=A0AAU7SRB8_9HYPH